MIRVLLLPFEKRRETVPDKVMIAHTAGTYYSYESSYS